MRDREYARTNLQAVLALGFASYDQLVSALPQLAQGDRGTAIWALQHFGKGKAVPPLLRPLKDPDPARRAAAITGLELVGGVRALRASLRAMRDDPDAMVRERAAHGPGFMYEEGVLELAFAPLLTVLLDECEVPAVRAQAAESLGDRLEFLDRRTRRFRQALSALLAALDHSAPELRFWAAFALGKLRSRQALAKLQHLATTEMASCPGWWAVRDEASDAVECIMTGGWPDHGRQCQPIAEPASTLPGCGPASDVL